MNIITTELLVSIQIDDRYRVTDFREPRAGELVLSNSGDGTVVQCVAPTGPKFIVVRRWEWPDWLVAPFLAMNSDKTWTAFTNTPRLIQEGIYAYWVSDGESYPISPEAHDFNPPQIDKPECFERPAQNKT